MSRMKDIPEGSTWRESIHFPEFPSLTESEEVDVLIIGGGLTGITAAYLLSQ